MDSTASNSTPDKFLFVSGNPATYPGRQTANTYYLSPLASPKTNSISYTRNLLSFSCRKIWLYIGYADNISAGTSASKNLYMSDIVFVAG